MKNGLKIVACMAACLSTLPLARSALADNRANSGRSAVFDQASSASCFAHAPGDWSLKNSCSSRQSVFLPTSVDAARWYTTSVFGRGLINPNGSHNNIACITNAVHSDGSLISTSGWQGLPNNGGFGGAQTIVLPAVPVFGPGDMIYTYCDMDPFTTIFGWAWN